MSMLLSVPLSKITRSRASVRPCCVREILAHLGDIGLLTADNEERALLDFGLQLEAGGSARMPLQSSFCTCSKSGLNLSKSSHRSRLAISSAARFSALERTWRSSVMSDAPRPSTPSSASSSSSSSRRPLIGRSASRRPAAPDDRAAQAAPAFLQRPQTIEAHGIEPLEDVAVFAMLRRASMLLDEALNLLEAGDDAFFARRAARSFFVSTSTPSSSSQRVSPRRGRTQP